MDGRCSGLMPARRTALVAVQNGDENAEDGQARNREQSDVTVRGIDIQ